MEVLGQSRERVRQPQIGASLEAVQHQDRYATMPYPPLKVTHADPIHLDSVLFSTQQRGA